MRVIENGTLYVLVKCITNVTTIKLWQHLPTSASGGDVVSEMGLSQVVVDGEVKLCALGCSDCSTGACSSCLDGYVFDETTTICYQCPAGCSACNADNPNSCSACLDGSFLSGTECLLCDSSCTTCKDFATSCQTCLPGQYFNGTNCSPCSRNCLNCTSGSSCDVCHKGFVSSDGVCRKCAQKCSSCEPSNIMSCTSCGTYLYLFEGSCLPCPSRCKQCNGATCAKCDTGYRPGADGSCVKNCELPCQTCSDTDPTHCLSCFYGSVIVGTTCQFDLSCNLDNSCTDCGQGVGYVLAGTTCIRCSNISNCKQCRQTNTQACALCSSGYYINGTTCSPCPSVCPTCLSASICTSCSPGFTIPNSAPQGNCINCSHPCLTCSGSSTYCTSCVEGFTKKNWMCQNNVYIGFSFTLNANDVASVLSMIDVMVVWLLRAMNLNTERVEAISFTSITLGSVAISGEGDPNAGSTTTSTSTVTSASSSLTSSLAAGPSIGSFGVTAYSVITNGVTTNPEQEENSNMGLIIGLSVGIPILLIIVIVVIVVYRKRRQNLKIATEEIVEKQELPSHPLAEDSFHSSPMKEGSKINKFEMSDVQISPESKNELVNNTRKQSIKVEQLHFEEEKKGPSARPKSQIKATPGSNSKIKIELTNDKDLIPMPETNELQDFEEIPVGSSSKLQMIPPSERFE